jgi:hypothetical protein
LPLAEGLHGLQDLGALEVPDLGGDLLQARADDGERGEEFRVTVPLEHLGADGRGFRPRRLHAYASTSGGTLAKVPTAPEILP